MNIYRNQYINLVGLNKSKFPKVSNKIVEKLWLDKKGRSGQDFLELALYLIGNYDFNKYYLKEIDDYTFQLKTKAGKTIKVQVEPGSVDDCPQIKVTEDKAEMSYDYVPVSGNSNLLYFDTTQQKDTETGFIQYYNGEYDEVLMEKDDIVTTIYFYCPNPPVSYNERKGSTYLVSSKLKESIKLVDPTDVVALYNTIAENLDEDIKGFEINKYNRKTRKTLDRIIASNKKIIYILLTKEYANGSVTLEEDNRDDERFSVNINNVRVNYDETLEEFGSLKRNLERKLIK